MSAVVSPFGTQAAAASLGSLAAVVKQARQVVESELPGWWPQLEGCLATAAAIRLASLDLCPTFILTGPSGVGKSSIIDMLDGSTGIVRVDSITSACFVSSSADVQQSRLRQIDLLPQVQHKVMVTRDLSTVFRKNNDQLRDLFGVLVPVLDGKGYAPSTGAQGLRVVTGNYIFCWIAATTPWPNQTWDTQKRFGSRTLHYDLFKRAAMTDEQVLAERDGKAFSAKLDVCREAVAKVLAIVFLRRPDGIAKAAPLSVRWGDDPRDVQLWRVKFARLVTACRQERGNIDEDEQDDPHRVITQLEALTRGRAMLYDRNVVTTDDLPLALHMALSSSRHGRVLHALVQHPEGLSVSDCAAFMGCSEQTARNRMDAVVRHAGGQVIEWGDPALDITGRGRPIEKVLRPVQQWSWLGDLKGFGWV